MRASIVFVLGLFLLVTMSVAYADDACRCKGCGCKGGPGWRGPDGTCEVCAGRDLRVSGRGALQAGIGKPHLLRQAVGIVGP
jgi:hypothetical protein